MDNNITPTIIKYVNGDVKIYENLTKISSDFVKNTELVSGIKIGNSVKFINQEAFYGCKNAKYITFSDSLIRIGERSFAYCEKIRSIELPIHTKIIGEGAFNSCRNLHTIILPECLKTVRDSTFAFCRQLKHLTIPKSVKYIENYAFYNCKSLNKIICLSKTSPMLIGCSIFFNISENGTLYYPKGSDYSLWKRRLSEGWQFIEM